MLSLFDTNPYNNPIRWFGKIKYMYLRFKFSVAVQRLILTTVIKCFEQRFNDELFIYGTLRKGFLHNEV